MEAIVLKHRKLTVFAVFFLNSYCLEKNFFFHFSSLWDILLRDLGVLKPLSTLEEYPTDLKNEKKCFPGNSSHRTSINRLKTVQYVLSHPKFLHCFFSFWPSKN